MVAAGRLLSGARGGLFDRLGLAGCDLAVDLGTANTVVFRAGRGVVLFEPSVVAVDEGTGAVHAVGEQARRMIGRTPASIRASRPLRNGVVADVQMAEQMLRYFMRKAGAERPRRPRVMVCVPSGLTGLERRAVEEATLAAGARRAYLMEEPLAGAIGAGLPVGEAVGSMIVDVGGGRSEMAVLALGSMVVSASLPLGGYELDEAIVRFLNEQHALLIGQEQAETVKLEIGSVLPLREELATQVAGRDRLTGLLRRASLNSGEVREALTRPVARIVEAVKETLDRTPPELSADIVQRGLVLVGGGALLRGIDQLLRRETGLSVTVAEAPLLAVATGAGRSLEDYPLLERIGRQRRPRTRRRSRRSRFRLDS